METSDKTLINSVIRMLDTQTNYDTLVHVLALLCVLSIVSRPQSKTVAAGAPNACDNPIQKILGQLTKGEETNTPDILMTLLPLLNNPQLKSKLNPANISSILSMLNNLGGGISEKAGSKQTEKNTKAEASSKVTPLAPMNAPEPSPPPQHTDKPETATDQGDTEKRRSLNWKSNF